MGETMGGFLRRGTDRVIAGVCSGLGTYFHIDATLVRVVFVILALVPPGVGIIVYAALWFLMEPAGPMQPGQGRTIRDRVRSIGDELRHEFRSGFGRSDQGSGATRPPSPADPSIPGGGPPPSDPHGWWGRRGYRDRPNGLWAGIILIALGAYFLLANLGVLEGFRWDLFWPVVLIAIGLLVLLRRAR